MPPAIAAPPAVIVPGVRHTLVASQDEAMGARYPNVTTAATIATIGRQNFLKNLPMDLNALLSHEYPLGSMSERGLFIT
jgi:hypothetical protein